MDVVNLLEENTLSEARKFFFPNFLLRPFTNIFGKLNPGGKKICAALLEEYFFDQPEKVKEFRWSKVQKKFYHE